MIKRILKFCFFLVAFIFVLASVLMIYFNMPGPPPRQDVSFGITFSARYAEALGLSWKETYIALLDEMHVRKIRLPLYWDLIEKNPGEYDFADVDWQLDEARERNAEVIVVMGQKVPRWPECFIPEWANTDSIRESSLLAFEKKALERYKDRPEIVLWQVENEPFLSFGHCEHFGISLLDKQIALVKQLDPSRDILTTDSGELSLWYQAAGRGDIFGTTLYRDIWSKRFGYVTYPLGPNFFLAKEMLVRLLTDQTRFIVIELQAEPWVNGWIRDIPLEEQFITMDEHKLVENIEYTKQVGFPEVYLWGAEWWYWMKVEKNYPAIWETAKQYFPQEQRI